MGAPIGNKNAAGSHSKGWYKKSNSRKTLKFLGQARRSETHKVGLKKMQSTVRGILRGR